MMKVAAKLSKFIAQKITINHALPFLNFNAICAKIFQKEANA
jgi:hypothetical protein